MKQQGDTKKIKPQIKQEYLVQVTIIEARNLRGMEGTGSCNPFIKIMVSGQAAQVTTTKKQSSNCVFNQSFTFTNIWMNLIELESYEVRIEVIDLMEFNRNRLIGQFSIALCTLFKNPQHEIYNKWLRLTHPDEGLEPQGYLLCSAYIISSDDRPPVHDINENQVEEEPDEFNGKSDDQLTGEELERRRAKKQQIAIVQRPILEGKSYQLMVNIYKAEDLPTMSFGSCDSFISVRAGGITLCTAVMKNMKKPQYAARLMFPLYFPVLNDKIVIRVWDKRTCLADTFIAMIPEIPKENDFFNVNFLQSRGGTMPFRWFSLYGIPADERPSNFDITFLGYKKKLIGTDYMGRVCLSFNLTPSEKPEKLVKPLNTFREPEIKLYLCRVDLYELQGAKDCGEFITIEVRIGSSSLKSERAKIKQIKMDNDQQKKQGGDQQKKGSGDSLNYTWKEQDIIFIKDEKVELPSDPQQIPDVFISLYDQWKKRQAYYRIQYMNPDLGNSQPKWYTLICVRTCNTTEGNEDVAHSYLLMNLMLRPERQIASIPRIPVKRNIKSNYYFHAYIYGGYDLCPNFYSEEVEVKFEIILQGFTPEIKLQSLIQGKNPIWNKKFRMNGILDENLEFASNILMKFENNRKKQGVQYMFDDNQIGVITIQPFKCLIIEDSMKEFKIEEFQPDYKYYSIMNKEGCSEGRILAAFHLQKLKKNQKNIQSSQKNGEDLFTQNDFKEMEFIFPIFGIRKLPQRLKAPYINVRIPSPFPQSTQKEEPYLKNSTKKASKLNEGILPPDLENKNYSQQRIIAQKVGEADITQWFSLGIQDPNFLQIVKLPVLVHKNLTFWPQVEIELRDGGNKNERFISIFPLVLLAKKSNTNNYDSQIHAKAVEFFYQGTKIQEINESEQQVNENDEGTGGNTTSGEKEVINQDKKQESNNENENEKKQQQQQQQKLSNNDQMQVEHKLMLDRRSQENIRERLQRGNVLNVIVEDSLLCEVTKQDKDLIEKESKWKINRLKQFLKNFKETQQVDVIKNYVKREIEKCQNEGQVDENKYVGISKDDDEGGGQFDYGRETLKGPYEEKIRKLIPYQRYELFRLSSSKYGIIGNSTNAFIKGDMKLIIKRVNRSTKMSRKGFKKNSEKYNFSLFQQECMSFFEGNLHVKVRVYLLRCINLAAQAQNIDVNHMLAGMKAFCVANPFPEITVGDGGGKGNGMIKHIYQGDSAESKTLSPEFFQMYELDAELPSDWKMSINICDKGILDGLIGTVEIDLEDRVLGEATIKDRIGYIVNREMLKNEKELLKFKFDAQDEMRKSHLNREITDLTQKIESFQKDKYSIPVEYCELKKQGQNQTSQGTLEMFIEVLPVDIAREIAPSPLSKPTPQEYEIRLVILETFHLPLNTKTKNNVVDIFVRATIDASASGKDAEISRETDTHLGSKDGDGQFNWRMKFPFIWPCAFPRIKLSVYDMNTFSTDECLGEATVSLKRVTNRLSSDGIYELTPTKVKISHPNYPDTDRGEVYIQLKIITKAVAESSPVGEGQDEPNEDPYLEKPTAGRGLADFFAGSEGGRGIMFYIKVVGGVLISLLILLVLFVKPGILVN